MIQQKIRSYRFQIRRRNHNSHMGRARYLNWVHNNPSYDDLVENLLYLVARCKFAHSLIQTRPLAQLINLINVYRTDWNGLLLIYHQIEQLNLIGLVCQKVKDIGMACEFIACLILDASYQNITENEWKQTIKQCFENMIMSCSKQIMKRMIIETHSILQNWNMNINQNKAGDIILVEKMLTIMTRISQNNMVKQSQLDELMLHLFITQNNHSMQVCQLICNFMRGAAELDKDILILCLKFLQLCQRKKSMLLQKPNNNRQIQKQSLTNSKQQADQVIVSTMTDIFIINNNDNISRDQKAKILLSQILYNTNIRYENRDLICFCLQDPLYQKGSQSTTTRQLSYLRLLHKVSFNEQWLCYNQVRQFILGVIHQIQNETQIKAQQFQRNKNIFTNQPSSFISLCDEPDRHRNRENLMVSILVNVLLNQHSHNCYFDYYSTIQSIANDLLAQEVLQKWCQNWRIVGNLQHLMIQLLSIKNQKMRIRILKISTKLLKWKELTKEAYRKIHLILKLYKLQTIYQFETYCGDSIQTQSFTDSSPQQAASLQFGG